METSSPEISDVKSVFLQCGTCAQTFGHLLNREFGNSNAASEQALDPLAGGVANYGYQCGMLWGSALAIGREAYRRYPNEKDALLAAVSATQHVVESFMQRTKTLNCKAIIGHNLRSVFGLAIYMAKTMRKGIKNSQCFNLAEDWAPQAMKAAVIGLDQEGAGLAYTPTSCASEVVKKMGGSDEEALSVAGFAGGLGLSGEACGALGAALWFRTLTWCREHPGEKAPMFNPPIPKKLIKVFLRETNSCMTCKEITACQFQSLEEHTAHVATGGCQKLLELLASTEI
ncbi:MAG: C_GCAxxG_C_C family protein [Saprospiraceae bacterium]|nr:C_GCAxxG_C_C family protein [Saprospiraceae bacterium]